VSSNLVIVANRNV